MTAACPAMTPQGAALLAQYNRWMNERLFDAAARLDAAQARLRAAEKGRVTKSGLVEAALELALDAFEAEGEQSPLCRRLGRTPSAGRPSR